MRPPAIQPTAVESLKKIVRGLRRVDDASPAGSSREERDLRVDRDVERGEQAPQIAGALFELQLISPLRNLRFS